VYSLTDGAVRPYIGAGASVLFALDPKVTNPNFLEVRAPDFKIAPAPGLVLQTGIDAHVWKSVYARLDVKFIALMLARAELDHVIIQTPGLPLFQQAEVGTAKMNVWVNPLIVQLGLGTDF
jgi:outer membrane protein W